MELKDIINDIAPMSAGGLALLEDRLTPRRVPARTVIIEQGKVSREVFFIRSGVLRNFALNDGKEHTRWFALDGDIIASMFSFAKGEAAIASVETLTDVDMLVLPACDARSLIDKSEEWARWVAKFLIDGLYVLERRYTFLGVGDAMSRYRNLQRMRSFSMLDKIPLQYIASYLNMTPQTLSNLRREMVKGKAKPKK